MRNRKGIVIGCSFGKFRDVLWWFCVRFGRINTNLADESGVGTTNARGLSASLFSCPSKAPPRKCYFRKCVSVKEVQSGFLDALKHSDNFKGFNLVNAPKYLLNGLLFK